MFCSVRRRKFIFNNLPLPNNAHLQVDGFAFTSIMKYDRKLVHELIVCLFPVRVNYELVPI